MSIPQRAAALVLAAALSGCVTSPGTGLIATKIRGPISAATEGPPPETTKVGIAESYMAFGLFAHGDASIDAAMKAGAITRIHHVDYEYKNTLGLFSVYSTIVYGE